MKIFALCSLFALTSRLGAQAPLHREEEVLHVPASVVEGLNRGFGQSGHHLYELEVVEHLEGGNFRSFTAHLLLTCPDSSKRMIELVFPSQPPADTLAKRLAEQGHKLLSLDEAALGIASNRELQLKVVGLVVDLGNKVCRRPLAETTPAFYASLSFWFHEGQSVNVYQQHITQKKYVELR